MTTTSGNAARVARVVALVAGVSTCALGLWAFVGPESFFDQLATFEPYNQHFIQDIGSFQIGLGAVLLLAVFARASALVVALVGVGVGLAVHAVSHAIGRDLGGNPGRDIPTFVFLAVVLLVAGAWLWREESPARS